VNRSSLDHVAVTCPSLESAVAWYQSVLGARTVWVLEEFRQETVERCPGLTAMAEVVVGEARIHLLQTDRHAQTSPVGAHYCLSLADVDQLTAIAQAVSECNGGQTLPVIREEENEIYCCYVRDPANNLIELRAPFEATRG